MQKIIFSPKTSSDFLPIKQINTFYIFCLGATTATGLFNPAVSGTSNFGTQSPGFGFNAQQQNQVIYSFIPVSYYRFFIIET